MTPVVRTLLSSLLLTGLTMPSLAWQAGFEDVIRNLRNPDPKARLSAVRMLRESQHTAAAIPVAAVVNDPIDEIQLEAIAAELSFFLVQDMPLRKRVGLVVEVRSKGQAVQAFEQGPLAAWPRPVPPEVVDALLKAVDDENPRVRIEAIYALGAVARPPLTDGASERLIKALDHYDPAIRAAAARVAGRLDVKRAGDTLINAINDSSPAGPLRVHESPRRHSRRPRGAGADGTVEVLRQRRWSLVCARRACQDRTPFERAAVQDPDLGQGSVHAPGGG